MALTSNVDIVLGKIDFRQKIAPPEFRLYQHNRHIAAMPMSAGTSGLPTTPGMSGVFAVRQLLAQSLPLKVGSKCHI